jgi:LysM repeat protein/ABC-type branched-subunit amino acid transport system substrate-binding protein
MIARKITLLVLLLMSVSLSLFAQQETSSQQSKISTDKVKIDGKYYFIHIVRRGETLYSISKLYNVSQMEIAMENPDIHLGLQVDQALKVPLNQATISANDLTRDDDYIYHIVRKGETLFGLSKKYDTSMEKIISINPEVETGIKLSQVILIPKRKAEITTETAVEKTERYIYHEVQPREGFYSITKKYGVTEQTIRQLNADLVKEGLKLGTILRIPTNLSDTLPQSLPITEKPIEIKGDSLQVQSVYSICDTTNLRKRKSVYNIALLLPLYTKEFENPETDSLGYKIPQSKNEAKKVPQRSVNFLDFYQGALIAIDSLKNAGMSVNLWVYDTEKNATKTKALLAEQGLSKADLIIGPIYPESLKPVAEFAKERHIPIVSPLSSNSFLLNQNPYIFQVNPSFTTQLTEFTKKMELCGDQNIVLIHEADSTSSSMVENLKTLIKDQILKCAKADQLHFKEVTYAPGSPAPEIQERISQSLAYEKENIIIVPSNNEAFVTDLLGTLHTLATYYKYPISLYGFPRWQRFRNVELDYYYKLQLHLFTPFYVDYSLTKSKDFVSEYRSRFRVEPTQFAFHGYDVFMYFLSALNQYGPDFRNCIQNLDIDLLQTEFDFKQSGSSEGFENRSINLIRYNKQFEINRVDTLSNEL